MHLPDFLLGSRLGVLSARIAQQPLPSDHVVRLVDGGQLDLHSPLRWYGTLCDEPARLPWGYGYEIDSEAWHLASVPPQKTPATVSGRYK